MTSNIIVTNKGTHFYIIYVIFFYFYNFSVIKALYEFKLLVNINFCHFRAQLWLVFSCYLNYIIFSLFMSFKTYNFGRINIIIFSFKKYVMEN